MDADQPVHICGGAAGTGKRQERLSSQSEADRPSASGSQHGSKLATTVTSLLDAFPPSAEEWRKDAEAQCHDGKFTG